MKVAIVGGTGAFGRALAEKLHSIGEDEVVIGSRDPSREQVRMVPELRRVVRFMRLNLMDASYPLDRDIDVIFCRNVLIYFDKPTQAKVLSRLCHCLAPGGYLFIGHSESITGFNLPVRTVANTIFQKI